MFLQLDLPVAVHAGDAENLPAADLETQELKPGRDNIADRQPHPAGSTRKRCVCSRVMIAPNHHLGEPGTACSCRRRAAGHAAIAQNHHLVAELQHFRQFVADEDDALSLRAQTAKDCQQIGDFGWSEIGGRLIEDQEVGFAQDCLENLDALPAAERQLADACKGVEVETKPSACLADPIRHRRRAQHATRRGPAEHDVLHHRHRIDQHEMLMDHRDAGGDRIARTVAGKFAATEDDFAGVGRQHSKEHLHQRALAGAVLAEQSDDLTRCTSRSMPSLARSAPKQRTMPRISKSSGID